MQELDLQKKLDDKITNNSARNEKVESNSFECSLQKFKDWLNSIELTLTIDKRLQPEIHKINHVLGKYVLKVKFLW